MSSRSNNSYIAFVGVYYVYICFCVCIYRYMYMYMYRSGVFSMEVSSFGYGIGMMVLVLKKEKELETHDCDFGRKREFEREREWVFVKQIKEDSLGCCGSGSLYSLSHSVSISIYCITTFILFILKIESLHYTNQNFNNI